MKKLQLLILSLLMVSTAVFAYNFDNTIPVKGKSITDSQLQSQMIMPIYYYSLRVAAQGCEDFAIVNTEISKPKNNNTWSEIWTVKACTRTARIPINFTQGAEKTDYAIDYMNGKVAK